MLFIDKTVQIDATIANISAEIDDLTARIERLRNEKLELEQYLQQLGSAENAAESAIEQVKTALSMIRAVTGDSEVQTFKDAIDALFVGEVKLLTPVPLEEPAIEVTVDNGDGDGDGKAENIVSGEFPTETEVIPDDNGDGHNGHGEGDDFTPVIRGMDDLKARPATAADLENLRLKQLRKLLEFRGLSVSGTKAQLIDRLLPTEITVGETYSV